MFYVDIPPEKRGDAWANVYEAETKEEAVQWIRNNIGPCDNEGNICLLSEFYNDDEEDDEMEAVPN